MQKLVVILVGCWLVASPAFAQGVSFVREKNWASVLHKATTHDKYVFVDCYATWCVPCKKMDVEVFRDPQVGAVFNAQLVAVRVQLDSSNKDPEHVRSWYSDAQLLRERYAVSELPTFLICAPDGTLVGRATGFLPKDSLLAFVQRITTDSNSYGALLTRYRKRSLGPEGLKTLALSAKELGQQSLADSVATQYRQGFLDRLPLPEKLALAPLEFMMAFGHLVTASDPWFALYYSSGRAVNRILGNADFSERMVDYVVTKDFIDPALQSAPATKRASIDWGDIERAVAGRLDTAVAARTVLAAKIGWYQRIQAFDSVAIYYAEQIARKGIDTSMLGRVGVNNVCWDVFFKHVADTALLNQAIGWMETLLVIDPADYPKRDTYANLLFKVGRRTEAIRQERLAIESIRSFKGLDEAYRKSELELYTRILQQMINNEPTWKVLKDPVSLSDFFSWPIVRFAGISVNGSVVHYTVLNRPAGSQTMVVQASKQGWTREFIGATDLQFFAAGTRALLAYPGQRWEVLELATGKTTPLSGVRSVTVLGDSSPWLLTEGADTARHLALMQTLSGRTQTLGVVQNPVISPDAQWCLYSKIVFDKQMDVQELRLLDINTMKETIVGRFSDTKDIVFSPSSRLLGLQATQDGRSQLYIYRVRDKVLQPLLAGDKPGFPAGVSVVAGVPYGFSDREDRFYFSSRRPQAPDTARSRRPTVWKYTDVALRGLDRTTSASSLPEVEALYAVDLSSRKIVRLRDSSEALVHTKGLPATSSRYMVVQSHRGNEDEIVWNLAKKRTFFLVDQATGARTAFLQDGKHPITQLAISPSQQYAVYYHPDSGHYFAYSIALQTHTKLTGRINERWYGPDYDDMPYPPGYVKGIAAFVDNNTMLVMGQYDLWQIDLTGKRPAVNVTQGRGRQEQIDFTLVSLSGVTLSRNTPLVLHGLNKRTKTEGFYQLTLTPTGSRLVTLSEEPKRLLYQDMVRSASGDYLLSKEDAAHAPNLYLTRDFKRYHQLSHVESGRRHQRLQSQLVSWAHGKDSLRGILYTPEGLDSSRRYPVIITYYNKLSDELHHFKRPETNAGSIISIPYFLAQGYLVLATDIAYAVGETGNSALESVQSAADQLARFSFVDTSRLGLAGHSFGGFQTNYIVTHSSRFKAALSGAGMSNLVSDYGSVWGGGGGKHSIYEQGPNRMPGTLWEYPGQYLKNSAVLHVPAITTPLLLMHNRDDGAVPFLQGVELFTAMRRQGKPVWLLEYAGESHAILEPFNVIDYQEHLLGFFDHYLRGKEMPRWMQ